MNYNNTLRPSLRYILFFLVAVTIIASYTRMLNIFSKEVAFYKITNEGTINYLGTLLPSPLPSGEVGSTNWLIVISQIVTILLGISALAKAIVDLIKRYLWRRKYSKGRTPIIMPARANQCTLSS